MWRSNRLGRGESPEWNAKRSVDVVDHFILGVGLTWVSLKERGVPSGPNSVSSEEL